MKLEDVKPAHCHARARRVLAEVGMIREEMGRAGDSRPVPEITGAAPREVYFEALALWNKADRLAREVGAGGAAALPPPAPALTDVRPGHVLGVIDAALGRLGEVRARVGADAGAEPAVEAERQPADVLVTLIRANRELSRCLEHPFAPEDVYQQVSLASSYAARLVAAGGKAAPSLAPFERKRRPADCYQRLESCLELASKLVEKAGHTSLHERGDLTDVVPGDVYDLASLVLGELAFLHAVTANAPPMHAFEPEARGHRLPAHVDQVARTLEAQLEALA